MGVDMGRNVMKSLSSFPCRRNLVFFLVMIGFTGFMGFNTALSAPMISLSPNALSAEDKALHVLNRLGFGPRPGDVRKVAAMGAEQYIQKQLYPNTIPENPRLATALSPLTASRMTPYEVFQKTRASIQGRKAEISDVDKLKARQEGVKVMTESAEAHMARAVLSERQLQEVMVDFWFNHFNVYGPKGLDTLWVGSFESQAVRPYAMGRFRDLLGATAHHPAMLFYLDNWQNTDPNSPGVRQNFNGLNENYARELMELHTLGVDGGYTQQDVVSLAKILTGWGIPGRNIILNIKGRQSRQQMKNKMLSRNLFYFDPSRHDYSTKKFLGQTIAGKGEPEGEQALDILAASPATAHHISYKLAQYFVSDSPNPALVERLSERFQATGGNIREVLKTLFASPEFWDPKNAGAKFKSPYRYVTSALRAGNQNVQEFQPYLLVLRQMGMPVYGCLTPDGYKNTRDAWLNPDTMNKRLTLATALARGQAVGKKKDGGLLPAIEADALNDVFKYQLSDNSRGAIDRSLPAMRAAMILGSPEFMMY